MFSEYSLEQISIHEYGYTELAESSSYQKFSQWVEKDWQGPLHYLSDHRKELRKDIRYFYPAFESALVFLFSYHQERNQLKEYLEKNGDYNQLKIASYALSHGGEDYRLAIKDKLHFLGSLLKNVIPEIDYKLTLDVHPVLERDLAYRSGLGWFGKNSMSITKDGGSFFMIGSILLNKKLDLPQKQLESDHCGTCRACVEICPTQAIREEFRQIEASQCVSTYTIELFKEEENSKPQLYQNVKAEIFGCDLCQDVCPWNKRIDRDKNIPGTFELTSKQKSMLDFFLIRPVSLVKQDLAKMTNGEFKRRFLGTALERTGRLGMLKNLEALTHHNIFSNNP